MGKKEIIPFQCTLLACASLLWAFLCPPALGAKDDLCTVFNYLAPTTHRQQIALRDYNQMLKEANRSFSDWHDNGKKSKLLKLHEEMIEEAASFLRAYGFRVVIRPSDNGNRNVLIIDGRALNRKGPDLPGRLQEKLGVEMIYDPYSNFNNNPGLDFHDSASFDSVYVNISNNGVRNLALRKRDVVTLHEVLHAHLEYLFDIGVDSPLHGDLLSRGGKKISRFKTPYDKFQSIDELATHAYEVYLEASNYRLSSGPDTEVSPEKLKKIIKNIRDNAVIGKKLSGQTFDVVNDILIAMEEKNFGENGANIKFLLEDGEFSRAASEPFIRAHIKLGSAILRIPLMPGKDLGVKPTPEAIKRRKSLLMRKLWQRLSAIEHIADKSEDLFQEVEEAATPLGGRTQAQDRELIQRAKKVHLFMKPFYRSFPTIETD